MEKLPIQNIRFIATDIDGTLLNSKNELNDEFYPVFRELCEKGILFAAASGRQYYNLKRQFSAIEDDLIFIAENGNYVNYQNNELLVHTLSADHVKELILKAENIPNCYTILCGTEGAYIQSDNPEFLAQLKKYYTVFTFVDSLYDVAHKDILKVTICDLVDAETNSYTYFKEDENRFRVKVSGKIWLDISEAGGDKGRAIRLIQEKYDILPEETMVFGDYLNDLEMLQQAYYSFAMANAHPRVLETARFKTLSNDADGVLHILKNLLKRINEG